MSLSLFAVLLALQADARAGGVDPVRTLEKVKEEHGRTLVVGAQGEETWKHLSKEFRSRPTLEHGVVFVRLPTVGEADDNMARALAEAKLACGLRFFQVGNTFRISTHGDCGPPPEPELATVEAGDARLTGRARQDHAELMALSDHGSRRALLTVKLAYVGADADLSARYGQALAVVSTLEARGEVDSGRVGAFLAAALADDAAVRTAAVAAAASGGDPPEVSLQGP